MAREYVEVRKEVLKEATCDVCGVDCMGFNDEAKTMDRKVFQGFIMSLIGSGDHRKNKPIDYDLCPECVQKVIDHIEPNKPKKLSCSIKLGVDD